MREPFRRGCTASGVESAAQPDLAAHHGGVGLEELGAELVQAAPLHRAHEGPARCVELFDHRALPTRFRDDAHDAALVAQQRTDGRARGLPPCPGSFLFHTDIGIDR